MSQLNRVKLAHLVRFGNGQDWKDVAAPDGEFPVYGSGGEFGRASDFLHDGEAILFGRKGTVDRPIYVNEKFWTVDTMYYAVPDKDKCLGKYLYYWGTTIPFETITTNTALPSVTSMDLSQLYVPIPPLESQQRIADYLDRETAEIDATVADLDRYVKLLEKRKKAVGSSLLDDAIEDMSTLMVHLGSVGTFISGSGFPHDYQGIEDEEYPFYKVGSLSTTDGNAIVRDFRNTVSKETALELGAKVIPGGSVLMAKIGEAMRLCRFAVNATNCCVDNNMMAIVPRFEHITTDYLRLALTLVTVDVLVNPGPVPSLNVQGLRMFSIPLPSLEIQERLTAEWKKETSEIDDLIAESTKLRDLLLKRRSVLITDVVTGRKQV